MKNMVRQAALGCCLVAACLSLDGCFYAPRGGGWCYHHPYRCR